MITTPRRATAWTLALCVSAWILSVPAPLSSQAAANASARTWVGRAPQIEEQLKTAAVTGLQDIGVGVTNPKRGHLKPDSPVESLVWKVLPPGRVRGYWESYKSEIAAYELDKLLKMDMVPPAVERRIDGDVGAAIMWVSGPKSVKEMGGKVPTGATWGKPLRRMLMFDDLIGNPDRNAGNILVGPPGELIIIDHSRAFITDTELPKNLERVDAELWDRMTALTPQTLTAALGSWLDQEAIKAMVKRRDRMVEIVDQLVKKSGRARVVIQ